jgi:hypothetical protein
MCLPRLNNGSRSHHTWNGHSTRFGGLGFNSAEMGDGRAGGNVPVNTGSGSHQRYTRWPTLQRQCQSLDDRSNRREGSTLWWSACSPCSARTPEGLGRRWRKPNHHRFEFGGFGSRLQARSALVPERQNSSHLSHSKLIESLSLSPCRWRSSVQRTGSGRLEGEGFWIPGLGHQFAEVTRKILQSPRNSLPGWAPDHPGSCGVPLERLHPPSVHASPSPRGIPFRIIQRTFSVPLRILRRESKCGIGEEVQQDPRTPVPDAGGEERSEGPAAVGRNPV